MTDYGDRASSREKDLVDLVVLATTHDIGGTALCVAMTTEARRRKMEPFDHFAVPPRWGDGYAKLSRSVPYCADYRTVDPRRPTSSLASSTRHYRAKPTARPGPTNLLMGLTLQIAKHPFARLLQNRLDRGAAWRRMNPMTSRGTSQPVA